MADTKVGSLTEVVNVRFVTRKDKHTLLLLLGLDRHLLERGILVNRDVNACRAAESFGQMSFCAA